MWLRASASIFLVVGAILSVVSASSWNATLEREASATLTSSANTAAAVVSSSLELDANLMAQLRGLTTVDPDLTNAEFLAWIDASGVSEQFPGGVGFGFIERVPSADLAAFVAARRDDPVSGLPVPDQLAPVPDSHPAEYCLQRTGVWNVTQVQDFQIPAGLDFCATELVPGDPSPLPPLLEAATDTGLATVLSPNELIPGVFAVFVAIYDGGVTPATVEERRAASIGWVAGSFRSTALTDNALQDSADLTIDVNHADPAGTDVLISTAGSDPAGGSGSVVSTVRIDPGWTIRVSGVLPVAGLPAHTQALVLLLTGLTLSVLGFLFIWLLGGSRDRALDLVEERTGELAHQALHDGLTGLPNRALILDRATGSLGRARRDGQPVAALFIDLDDFKSINDTLGHPAGDELLRQVASRFTDALRSSDTVGRLGGDEFVILVEGPSLAGGTDAVAERMLEVFVEPFVLGGEEHKISASVGIAAGPRATAEDWLRDADIALYEAKAAGKNGFVVFESAMEEEVQTRVALQHDLHDALDSDQFLLLYQPTVDLRSGETTGVEALIRWAHPTHGVVRPDAFIPTAERNGLIIPIGRWVLYEACRQGAEWNRRGRRLTMSVNVSARQLDRDAFVDDVRHALTLSGLDPALLLLEITETSLMQDADATHRRLLALSEVGVRIAIDDFGTGYSSMAHLRRFPVDVIKIDRSFSRGITGSSDAAALMRTLVQVGRAMGLATCAQGIEDDAQRAFLVSEGCDDGQGFLFAPPLTPTAVEDLLHIAPLRAADATPARSLAR